MSGSFLTTVAGIHEEGFGVVKELLKQGYTHVNDYLILGVQKSEFAMVYNFLADKYTVEIHEPYDVIGQTIDGDWILYLNNRVTFIHKSLDKEMVEEYDLTPKDFLIALYNKELKSNWLAD